jgi:hypothetical protein
LRATLRCDVSSFAPGHECLTSGLSVIGGGDEMTSGVERVVPGGVKRKEPLCGSGRSKPLHLADLGNVRQVKEEADCRGLRTRPRKAAGCGEAECRPFTRGHIYKILSNPVYAGEVVHKGKRYAGEHEAIVDATMWERVQGQLKRNNVQERLSRGEPAARRTVVTQILRRADLRSDALHLTWDARGLAALLGAEASDVPCGGDELALTLQRPVALRRRGVEMKLLLSDGRSQPVAPDAKLVGAVARAHTWLPEVLGERAGSLRELARRVGCDRADLGRELRLAFLAPDIVEAIIEGRQPLDLTAARLRRLGDLPVLSSEPRRLFGFHPSWPIGSSGTKRLENRAAFRGWASAVDITRPARHEGTCSVACGAM